MSVDVESEVLTGEVLINQFNIAHTWNDQLKYAHFEVRESEEDIKRELGQLEHLSGISPLSHPELALYSLQAHVRAEEVRRIETRLSDLQRSVTANILGRKAVIATLSDESTAIRTYRGSSSRPLWALGEKLHTERAEGKISDVSLTLGSLILDRRSLRGGGWDIIVLNDDGEPQVDIEVK